MSNLAPAAPNEVLLQPGDFYFGDRGARLRTFLGSCIAIVMWHPVLSIGGMSHSLLPTRGGGRNLLDGRYVDEAMQLFLGEIRAAGTRPEDYQLKLFGGGNMFPEGPIRQGRGAEPLSQDPCFDPCGGCEGFACTVGCRNCLAARVLVRQFGLTVTAQHLGSSGHRQVKFDVSTGHVWIRQTRMTSWGAQEPAQCR